MSEHMKKAAKRVYHVGRLDDDGSATFAFNIRRRDDGGIGLSNVKLHPTDVERTHLFAHFGRKLTARTGGASDGRTWEGFVEREPGTEEHFVAAVHSLPDPFCLVSSED
jgi:hypothetical protein